MHQDSDYHIRRLLDDADVYIQNEISQREYTERNYISRFAITKEQYWHIFRQFATLYLRKKGNTHAFSTNNAIGQVIKQMYLYTMGSDACEWPINKGFILAGNIGVGKTMLMNVFIETFNKVCEGKIKTVHVKTLVSEIKKNGIGNYQTGRLFIDDMGRESKTVKDFGTEITPLIDLLDRRYITGQVTYFTTNYTWEDLKEFYGEYLTSRIKEMCVLVAVKGASLRPEMGGVTYGK